MDRVSMGTMVAEIDHSMVKIVSFGDSFILGSEIQDNQDGSRAWPGQIAQRLGCHYETRAVAGCGNEHIARQIYEYFSTNPAQQTLAIINWTWSMRWDFFLSGPDRWVTLGPTCVPGKLQHLVDQDRAQELVTFYHHYLQNSDQWNKLRSLQSILAAQQYLSRKGIRSIQTYMDARLFENSFDQDRLEHYQINRDPSWPMVSSVQDLERLPLAIQQELAQSLGQINPAYIQELQVMSKSPMKDFEGRTFLDWSRHHGYPITDPPGDHPLDQAHMAAADLWQARYQQEIKNL